MENKSQNQNNKPIKELFRKKEKFHKEQARLSIEEKIKILVELQKITLNIKKRKANESRRVWEI